MTAKHIVNVSGGMASAVTLFRVLERFGADDTLAVFADTNSEDADLYRFLDDVERVAGIEIVRLTNDGRTIWDVFNEQVMFTTPAGGCVASWHLKRGSLESFYEAHGDPINTTRYVGFDWDEQGRMDRLRRAVAPWRVDFPLAWKPILSRCDLADELRSRGIEPPRLYGDGYPHNNCAGACILAGVGQWAGLLRDNPDLFRQSEEREQAFLAELRRRGRTEITILKDRRGGDVGNLSLRQLREEIESGERLPRDTWRASTCQCMSLPFGV